MSNYRDFDAMLREKSEGRPSFTVAGQKFECRSKLSWRKFAALMISLDSGGDMTSERGLKATEQFFSLVLLPESKDRFLAVLNDESDDKDDDEYISPEQVTDLLDWLMEYYTGKVEEKEEPSSPQEPDAGLPVKSVSLNTQG